MPHDLLQIRKLAADDWNLVKHMKTNLEYDYVVDIFPDLISSNAHELYGLFSGNQLAAIAGYTLFPGGMAMLGRLRSDNRFLSQGHATELLAYIIASLKENPQIRWVGANTNEHNFPARRVLEKLNLEIFTTLHSLPVVDPQLISGTPGPKWERVNNLEEKRALLRSLDENAINVFPYECYYPLPLTQELLTDEYLAESAFYLSPDRQRFCTIKNDHKREWYAQVKYFWNDQFDQPGFMETVMDHLDKDDLQPTAWFDFSQTAFENIPDKRAFRIEDAWVLYGTWI
ncbi:GNAT family N-acetyltransferase [Sediminibacillus dalangtanensis]|uniref:GNAT family N-acetyltransferase n=1 Tax=Sediminibacillus dalangtanensis TaxID=2729421 RepID=A0ABX7VZT1_9BACI|nr:GNAT family N-acetyltransferase [Sediminibacillus dalangtanensis]QTN00272.1 GNAT family N-acetyltransferase [Sediminibacillus dalangtanensis]